MKKKTKKKKVAPRRRRNFASAEDLYEKFHGKKPRGAKDTGLPVADYDSHPKLAQLGRMVSLTVQQPGGKPQQISWGKREAPDLASEPNGNQLYVVGGAQQLDPKVFVGAKPKNGIWDLGFGVQVEYFTQKHFDDFQPVTYFHDLGEETGVQPRIKYDARKKRIHFVGGAYKVKPEGIVN